MAMPNTKSLPMPLQARNKLETALQSHCNTSLDRGKDIASITSTHRIPEIIKRNF